MQWTACLGGGRSNNGNNVVGYVLKADIKHYFETVDQEILRSILRKKICDEDILWLIKIILEHHRTEGAGKGMPLGNLTSQFFANVYLNELDYFVKHGLKAKYYLRYVDDFIILGRNRRELEELKIEINEFLKESLKVELHPEKSRVVPLRNGITLLGFRVFYNYKLLKKSNQNRIEKRILKFQKKLARNEITKDQIRQSFAGWNGYAMMANTYNLRKRVRERIEWMLQRPQFSNLSQATITSFF